MSKTVRPQPGLDPIVTYIPGKPIEDVKRELGLDDVIKLASNENPLGVSPKALAAMREALPNVNLYPDGASYKLRQALADHFGLLMDQVAVGNGADDLILELSMAYIGEGDQVIASYSSFPLYDIYTHAMRGVMIKTPLAPGYRIDLDAMAAAITHRTKMIYVCNPNNPTGTIVTGEELDAFVERVPDHVLIVIDEAYYEMVEDNAFPDSFSYLRAGARNVFILRTFSKAYGLAGLRLGYGFGHLDAVAPLRKIKPAFNVNVLAQAAGLAALEDTEFLEHSVAMNCTGRHYLYREFDRLGLDYAQSHTNFVLVRIGPSADYVQQTLLHRGIIVRPCAIYNLPEFLRISIGTPEQNARFVATLEEILQGQ